MRVLALVAIVVLAAGAAHAQSNASSLSSPVVAPQDNGVAGFRLTVTQAGMNKFLHVLLPLINQQFQSVQLPDIHMDEKVPVVGNTHIDITDIWIRNFEIPNGQVKTSAPNAVFFEIGPAIHLHFSANFHYRAHHWPHISGHGSVEATPEGGDIRVDIAISPSADGHFQVHVNSASCVFHGFHIKFHGGMAWLVNIFVRMMKNQITKAIDQAVAKQLHVLVDRNMNAILSKIPTRYQVGAGAGAFFVNIPLVQSVANNNWLDLGFPLTVNNARGGGACPHPIPEIPQVDAGDTGRMLQMFLGQHFFNCANWVNFENHLIDRTIQSSTQAWAGIIPQLQQRWPNSRLDVRMVAKQQDHMTFAAAGVHADSDLRLDLTVTPSAGGAPVHACALEVASHINFKVWIATDGERKPRIFLNVKDMTPRFGVIESSVGNIDMGMLNLLAGLIVPIITGAVDELLKGGFPIPIHKGLGLVRDEILFRDGYVLAEADFEYTSLPPAVNGTDAFPEGDMTTPDVIYIEV